MSAGPESPFEDCQRTGPFTLSAETHGPRETEALGARLAEQLRPGDVVVVSGELGAGKTTLVRGAIRALGVSDPVTSPTFSIGHRYHGGMWAVSHLDLYRVASLELEEPELLDGYLGPDRVAFVEWPPRDAPELSRARFAVSIRHGGGDRRMVEIGERASGAEQQAPG